MSSFADFEYVDVFTTGAIGVPGARTFYLQARAGARSTTIRCEKQQAAAIAQYLRRALNHLPVPEGQPPRDVMNLVDPFEEEFVLGSVALEFDRTGDHFVVHLREFSIADEGEEEEDDDESMGFEDEGHDDEDEPGSRVRVSLTRAQAMAFCEHTDRVVSSGRPDCVFCLRPMNPEGHFCPRMN